MLLEELCSGHVGRQHAFFDQLVRIVTGGRANVGDLAIGTEDDPGFLGLKINRATGMTSRQQHLVQRVKLLEVRHYISVFAAQLLGFAGFWLFQDSADLVVGQTGLGVDHRLVELVVGHFAGFGDGHLAHHGQTVDFRVQGAQAVGQLLRQHRDHALREVHRVAANLGFGIQRRTDFHVAGNVGNRHVQLPAAGEQAQLARLGFAEYGVIEVAGIFAVNGDERQMTQVDAFLFVFFFDFRLQPARFLKDSFRPDMRNVVGAQGNIDFHARSHVVAYNLKHIALRLETRGRPVSDLHFDELTDLGASVATRGHQHFLLDLRVVGHDKTNAAFFKVATDDGFVSSGDHFNDHAFTTTTAVQPRNTGQRAITIEHQAHLRRAHKQVVAAVIRHQEAEAIAVATDATENQVKLVHRRVSATAGVNQLGITLHRTQATAQGLDLVFCSQTELFHQLFTSSRRATLGQVLKDQFAARDRVFVFFRFTCGLGIEGLPIGH